MTKQLDREDRLERHYRRLGTRNPVCVSCGKCEPEHPEIYELHHVAGKSQHGQVSVQCANCHRTLSDQQKDHVPPGPKPTGKMAQIAHYLLGLADMLAMIVQTLREFGAWLMSEAQRAQPA
jgi:ferredoxin